MKGSVKTRFLSFAAIILVIVSLVLFEYFDERDLEFAEASRQKLPKPPGEVSIVIKLNSRILELYSDDEIYKRYRIAVGKSSAPSPVGEWLIVYKSYSDRQIFGTRWMGLNVPWGCYGIHGTNRPWSIGQFASQECIRLRNADIEELFEWVPIKTPVKIIGPKGKVRRALKYTSSGPDVVTLQLRLQQLGFYGGRADGLYGKTTEEAVRNYQSEYGLEPNGMVDLKLARRLGI